MFDLLGGFVVKIVPADSGSRVRRSLEELAFECVILDGRQLTDKPGLMAAVSERTRFDELCPGPLNNWDALSDLMWQRVQGIDGKLVTKLAVIVENGSAADTELMFQFAEVCINLQS